MPSNPNSRLRRRASVPNAPSQTRGAHDRNVFQDLFRRHRDDSEMGMSTVERGHDSVSLPFYDLLYFVKIVSFKIRNASDCRNRLMQTNLSSPRQQLPKAIRVSRAPRRRIIHLQRSTTMRVNMRLHRHLNMLLAKKTSRLFSRELRSSCSKGVSMIIITHR